MIDPRPVMPIVHFPDELFEFRPDVVILTAAMGALDAHAAVEAFVGRAGRIVFLSSGDVDRVYGRFTGIEAGPIQKGMLSEDARLRSVLSRTETGDPIRRRIGSASSCSRRSRIQRRREAYTPATAERMAWLPTSAIGPDLSSPVAFAQHIAYDTGRVGYCENVPEGGTSEDVAIELHRTCR
jgi:hypothetical protein